MRSLPGVNFSEKVPGERECRSARAQRGRAITRKMTMWLCLLMVLLPLFVSILVAFLLFDLKWTFLLLGALPWIVFLAGAYTVRVPSQRFYEIERNLTEAERRRFSQLSMRFGALIGLIVGILPALISSLVREFVLPGMTGYLIGFWLTFFLILPIVGRCQRILTRFALSTEYARARGWNSC